MHDPVTKVQVDEGKLYCKLCLEAQQALGDKGHFSEVAHYTETTSTGNMNLHLSIKHDIDTSSEEKMNKISAYLKKYTTGADAAEPISSHETNRDIALVLERSTTI